MSLKLVLYGWLSTCEKTKTTSLYSLCAADEELYISLLVSNLLLGKTKTN